jgi:hypothetical protein
MSATFVGQTMYATKGGRPVPIVIVYADDHIVRWRSLDLQFAGDMTPSRWIEMRERQRAAMAEEAGDGR